MEKWLARGAAVPTVRVQVAVATVLPAVQIRVINGGPSTRKNSQQASGIQNDCVKDKQYVQMWLLLTSLVLLCLISNF